MTSIATVSPATVATVWTTKNGTTKTRASALGALSAPKSAQVGAAIAADLQRWTNGNCSSVVRDIRALLTDKQALAVATAATLNPANKPDSMAFLSAALVAMGTNAKGEAVTIKGEKARFASLITAIQAHETEREAARVLALAHAAVLAGTATAEQTAMVDADTAPAGDVAPVDGAPVAPVAPVADTAPI